MKIETKLIKYLQSFENLSLNNVARIISLPFHFYYFIIVITFLYFLNNINDKNLFIILSSQFLLITLKYIVKRNRPFIQDKNIKNLETMNFDNYSFPSGHTFNAFLLYFIIKPTNKIWITIPILVGLSRIYMGVHYLTDIIGAILFAKILF